MSSPRNFFVTTEVDGRATRDASGPRSKDGGFTARIDMRSQGGIMRALEIEGFVLPDGKLCLRVFADGELVHEIKGER